MIGNKKTRETVYKALLQPVLEYATSLGLLCMENKISGIKKVQYWVVRWFTNQHPETSSVNTILDSQEWPTLQKHHRDAWLEVYKCSYDIPSCRPLYRQMSFFLRMIPDWNGRPQKLMAAATLDYFNSWLTFDLKYWPYSSPFPSTHPSSPSSLQPYSLPNWSLQLPSPYNALPDSKSPQTVSESSAYWSETFYWRRRRRM